MGEGDSGSTKGLVEFLCADVISRVDGGGGGGGVESPSTIMAGISRLKKRKKIKLRKQPN